MTDSSFRTVSRLKHKNMPLVYIIILNWNDYQSTLSCIESLHLLEYKNYKIIVFDNGSSNQSVKILSAVSDIELYCNDTNIGFSGGNNKAIKIAVDAGADYVWLLNSDTAVDKNCLTRLINTAQKDKSLGLVSPVIYESGSIDKIQHCGTRLDLSIPFLEEAESIIDAQKWQNELPYQMVLWGTALLIPSYVIEKIGLLDEHLFAYSEDTDYSIRSTKAGFKNITVFDANIWHQAHTGHRKPHYYYYVVRNALYFWKKHLTFKLFLKSAWWHFHQTKKRIAELKSYPEQIDACLLGLWDGWCGVGGEYMPHRKAPWLIRKWLGSTKVSLLP